MSTPTPAPTQGPVAPPAVPAVDGQAQPKKDRGEPKEKETIAGVAIPGGALTGIIVACAMLHFGGPLLLLGAAAAAAAGGTTAAVAKARKAASKGASVLRGGAGAGAKSGHAGRPLLGPASRPGTPAGTAGRAGSGAAGQGSASTHHKPVPSPAGHRQNGVPLRAGSATKAGGVSAVKAGQRSAGTVPAGRGPGAGAGGSAAGSMGRASGGGASGGSGASRHAGGAAGRLATIARRITGTQPTAPDAATKPKSKKADTKHAKDKTKDKAKGKKLDTPKVTGKGKKGAGKRPKPPHRRIGRAWRSTRRRVRAAYRWASPRIARALIRTRMTLVRWRTRANLVRLRHLGPNWWPGIAKAWAAVMNGLIKAGGSIAFLPATRRWIAGYMPRKVDVADITLGPVSSNVRVIYTSTPTTGAPPMADPVIIEAAEQIRNAFATIAADPASSMRGYEAALLALPDLLEAIGEGLNGFADVTRDQFSVQEAVPDMLGEGASHAQGLGSFLADVHAHYRSLHEQQITNYEEPTVGSEKWDVVANQE